MRAILGGILAGVVGTILIAIAVWLTVVYTGAYNVSAADQHFDIVRWTLDTTMHRSVEARADGVVPPENITEQMIAEGASQYSETCVHCHGAPGEERAEWALGMRPMPPELVEAAAEWELTEIQWIVTNGIKMTGMPAFGEQHSPEEIAAIAAFVDELPGLTPEDYASLSGGGHSEPDHSGGDGDATQAETATEPDAPEAAPRGEQGAAPESPPAAIEPPAETAPPSAEPQAE